MGVSVYKMIKTEKQLDRVIAYCKKTKYASIDFETDGRPFQAEMSYPTVLGISFQPGSAYVLPLGHFDSCFKENREWVRLLKKFGKEVLENPEITKIAWNLKFEFKWLLKYDIHLKGRLFDGMLAKYLLDEERPNGLKDMVRRYLPEFADYEEDYEGSKLPWDEKPLKGLSKYCALDCDLTFRLMLFFEQKLIDLGFYELFRNMLMMGTKVLAYSEFHGMDVDLEYLDALVERYAIEIKNKHYALSQHKRILKYERFAQTDKLNKLIKEVRDEITIIEEEIADSSLEDIELEKFTNRKQKQITSREEKISRYYSKDFTTKKELSILDPVNFSSPTQLIDLFFKHPKGFRFKIVKYTVDKKTKKQTDRPSTDEEVLSILLSKDKTGFIQNLLDYRGLTKLNSTYVVGMREKVSTKDRIHGSFLLHGTVTGRLSSRDPNLQNIPRDTTASDIKPMFVPKAPYLLLQLDYSQAELRVLAAEAGETKMIEWFKSGKDIHLASACKKWDEDYDEIIKIYSNEDHPEFKTWKIRRKQAKTINFGIVYGQGPKMLAPGLSDMKSGVIVTPEEAKSFLKDFDRDFPMIKKHINNQHKFVRKNGYVYNVFGRKRRLPNIDLPMYTERQRKDNWGKVAECERQSVNAPIQGAASDYTLFSSIIIWEKIQQGIFPKDLQQVYTVHDSLGYYIRPEDIHWVIPKLEAICRNPQTMKWFGFQIDDVEMKVDFEVGTNWGELKGYDKNFDYTTLH
jgi:DNA polymerase I-like protein with 3'-5' exonuclease and polymerase domains